MLLVSDRAGAVHRYPLSGKGAPCLLVQHPIDGVRSTVGHAWAVLDSHRMSFFSTETDLWSAEDFAKLAKAADLTMGDVTDRPRGTRPDAVDMSAISMPWWKMTLILIVPLLLISAGILLIKALIGG
jgi:hypothetical protein